jgi:hypothetical protein
MILSFPELFMQSLPVAQALANSMLALTRGTSINQEDEDTGDCNQTSANPDVLNLYRTVLALIAHCHWIVTQLRLQ